MTNRPIITGVVVGIGCSGRRRMWVMAKVRRGRMRRRRDDFIFRFFIYDSSIGMGSSILDR
jgi:hypothetical protein